MKADLPKREPAMLALWEKEKVYEKALERRLPVKGKKQFVLHDGPPYANGNLHLGHALNKILKDIIVRYKTMAGYYAPYVPGWDCHGLPIELQLMKELKITDKHKVDRLKFREQAKAFAGKYVDIQREEFKRMGILGDWDHPYLTMDPGYEKVIVDSFLELEKKDYIYRGKKPVYWCTTDETALAEAEVEYEEDKSPSIYVAFPTSDPKIFYAVWTTTPWTLPANVAIAYNPMHQYMRLVNPKTGLMYILAVERGEEFKKILGLDKTPVPEKIDKFPDARHPWITDRVVKLLPAEFVEMDAGTGLVHIAPGHGVEDYQLGQQQKPPLPVLSPVDDRGLFTDEVPEWKGQHVFKANKLIIDFLKKKGALLHQEEITHSYPHCWRCHNPVIFRATMQWFLNVEHEQLRERLLKAINDVNWIPSYGKNRITGMVETRPDWCLSRQRLWGTEIPTKEKQKEPDIVDVWFESGVSWAAVLEPRHEFPADMYLEGSDQHRGWFQTSLIPSVALRSKAPYKTVITHGFVMDGEGKPMSKSMGNVISPQEIIKQYGADILRFWVASSDYGSDVRLSPEILKNLADVYRKVRNTLRYILGNLTDFDPLHQVAYEQLDAEEDRWVLGLLNNLLRDVTTAYDNFEFHRVTLRLIEFCAVTLSGIYFDILKDRLYCDAPTSVSRRSAQTVLYQLAEALIPLLAPILPYTADESWHCLSKPDNVALADIPSPKEYGKPQVDVSAIFEIFREPAYRTVEVKRKEGLIGSSEEAIVILNKGSSDDRKIIHDFGLVSLARILKIAKIDLRGDADPNLGFTYEVRHAREEGFKKCERCWRWRPDIGAIKNWQDICARCAQVLEDRGVPA